MSQRFLFDRADGRGAHAFDVRVLLQHHEDLEQRRRGAREDVVVDGFEVVVAHLEARVQRPGRRGLGEDRFAEQLQQQVVEQHHVHDRAVVALHELLDRERVRRVLVAEHLRELDLVVEQQPVLAPSGHDVQREAHLPQEGLRLLELAQFATATGSRASSSSSSELASKWRFATHAMVWMSRRPPGPVLTFGSRL